MKVMLDIGERMVIAGILPKESNFVTLRIIRTLHERLPPSADEMKEFEVTQKDEIVTWNEKGGVPKEFEFEDVERDLIKKELTRMDSENKLTQDMFTVYEKFLITGGVKNDGE